MSWILLGALLAASAPAFAQEPSRNKVQVGTSSFQFDFAKQGPRELLAFLSDPNELAKPVWRMRVDHHYRGWITESDIPFLLTQLDSKAPCLSVYMAVSSFLPTRVTVGDMAAYLIDSYRIRYFPKSLYSRAYTDNEKQEMVRWWKVYSEASRSSREDYEEVKARSLELSALPPAEQRANAALEVNRMARLLETSDEATTVYVADVLKMAGCEASSALPTLKAALSRFPEPQGEVGREILAMVVPKGAWGSLYNAITFIEGDNHCEV
jgi:hypothetical protein